MLRVENRICTPEDRLALIVFHASRAATVSTNPIATQEVESATQKEGSRENTAQL